MLLNLFNLKQTIQSFTATWTSFPLKWNQGWFLGMFALGCISSTQPSAFDTLRYAQTWRVSPRQPGWRDGERIQKPWKQTNMILQRYSVVFSFDFSYGFSPQKYDFSKRDPDGSRWIPWSPADGRHMLGTSSHRPRGIHDLRWFRCKEYISFMYMYK